MDQMDVDDVSVNFKATGLFMKLIMINLHQDIMAGLLDDDEDADEDLSKLL